MTFQLQTTPQTKTTTNELNNMLGFVPSLSETEMLDMEEVDYMCDVQLHFFKTKLLELREQQTKRALSRSLDMAVADASADLADRATAEEEHAVTLRSQSRDLNSLLDINLALKRIDDGEYGWCVQTGEPIGIKRLLAQPTASRSVDAQNRQEQLGRYFAK